MLFSIIVPVYNTEKYLSGCLDSLLNQSCSDLEVIAVDDASTDGSAAILDARAAVDHRLTVIRQPANAGPDAARKVGIDAARGKYLMFVDSDDYLDCGTLAEVSRTVAVKPYDFVQFGFTIEAPEGRPGQPKTTLGAFTGELNGRAVFDYYFFNDAGGPWTRVVLCGKAFSADLLRTQDWEVCRNCCGEDFAKTLRLAYRARSCFGLPGAYYHYRLGAGICGRHSYTAAQYETLCRIKLVYDGFENFFRTENLPQKYFDTLAAMRLKCWKYRLVILRGMIVGGDRDAARRIFLDCWGRDFAAAMLDSAVIDDDTPLRRFIAVAFKYLRGRLTRFFGRMTGR